MRFRFCTTTISGLFAVSGLIVLTGCSESNTPNPEGSEIVERKQASQSSGTPIDEAQTLEAVSFGGDRETTDIAFANLDGNNVPEIISANTDGKNELFKSSGGSSADADSSPDAFGAELASSSSSDSSITTATPPSNSALPDQSDKFYVTRNGQGQFFDVASSGTGTTQIKADSHFNPGNGAEATGFQANGQFVLAATNSTDDPNYSLRPESGVPVSNVQESADFETDDSSGTPANVSSGSIINITGGAKIDSDLNVGKDSFTVDGTLATNDSSLARTLTGTAPPNGSSEITSTASGTLGKNTSQRSYVLKPGLFERDTSGLANDVDFSSNATGEVTPNGPSTLTRSNELTLGTGLTNEQTASLELESNRLDYAASSAAGTSPTNPSPIGEVGESVTIEPNTQNSLQTTASHFNADGSGEFSLELLPGDTANWATDLTLSPRQSGSYSFQSDRFSDRILWEYDELTEITDPNTADTIADVGLLFDVTDENINNCGSATSPTVTGPLFLGWSRDAFCATAPSPVEGTGNFRTRLAEEISPGNYNDRSETQFAGSGTLDEIASALSHTSSSDTGHETALEVSSVTKDGQSQATLSSEFTKPQTAVSELALHSTITPNTAEALRQWVAETQDREFASEFESQLGGSSGASALSESQYVLEPVNSDDAGLRAVEQETKPTAIEYEAEGVGIDNNGANSSQSVTEISARPNELDYETEIKNRSLANQASPITQRSGDEMNVTSDSADAELGTTITRSDTNLFRELNVRTEPQISYGNFEKTVQTGNTEAVADGRAEIEGDSAIATVESDAQTPNGTREARLEASLNSSSGTFSLYEDSTWGSVKTMSGSSKPSFQGIAADFVNEVVAIANDGPNYILAGLNIDSDTGQRLGSAESTSATFGDFDGDDQKELVFGNVGAGNKIYERQQNASFTASGITLGGNATRDIEAGYLDNDRCLDIVAFNDGANVIHYNDCDGTLNFSESKSFGSGDSHAGSIADANADGPVDIAVARDGENKIFFNNFGPVAQCKDKVSKPAGPSCERDASIDSGSFDRDATKDDINSRTDKQNFTPDGGIASTSQDPAGPYTYGTREVKLTAEDTDGATDMCTTTVEIRDETPPTITVGTERTEIWPPNHKCKTFDVMEACDIEVTDNCASGNNLVTEIAKVTSDELFDSQTGDGSFADDIELLGDNRIELRAERKGGGPRGSGNGRVYSVTVEATDGAGNTTTGSCEFAVPHDQRPQTSATADGPVETCTPADDCTCSAPPTGSSNGANNRGP